MLDLVQCGEIYMTKKEYDKVMTNTEVRELTEMIGRTRSAYKRMPKDVKSYVEGLEIKRTELVRGLL